MITIDNPIEMPLRPSSSGKALGFQVQFPIGTKIYLSKKKLGGGRKRRSSNLSDHIIKKEQGNYLKNVPHYYNWHNCTTSKIY